MRTHHYIVRPLSALYPEINTSSVSFLSLSFSPSHRLSASRFLFVPVGLNLLAERLQPLLRGDDHRVKVPDYFSGPRARVPEEERGGGEDVVGWRHMVLLDVAVYSLLLHTSLHYALHAHVRAHDKHTHTHTHTHVYARTTAVGRIQTFALSLLPRTPVLGMMPI